MMRRSNRADRRQGVILLVVLAMLTIFTLVGLSFVMYADSAATRARIFREAASYIRIGDVREQALISATAAWNDFLGQVIYDAPEDATGKSSVLWGHSLARTMYGWYANPTDPSYPNDRPYNGTGRMENPENVNYVKFGNLQRPAPGYLSNGQFGGDVNVDYTYPDRNNMFLARLGLGLNGELQVITPSYRRLYNEDGNNPQRQLHYLNKDMANGFPTLEPDKLGHVKTLDSLGQVTDTDSVWLDYNGTVHEGPDGRKYKCLVAPVILDLDGRLNLNTAGNRLLNDDTASNQGWGPWEANPAKLSLVQGALPATNALEWRNILFGSPNSRYGNGGVPLNSTGIPGGTLIRNTYPIDFNGKVDPPAAASRTGSYLFPGDPGTAQYGLYPFYPANGYGNANPKETTTTGVLGGPANHPALYNPLRPNVGNRAFTPFDLRSLLRRDESSTVKETSPLLDLLPGNLKGNLPAEIAAARLRRAMVTTHSWDLDRPGSPAAIWDRGVYRYPAPPLPLSPLPSSPLTAPARFPTLAERTAPQQGFDFDSTTWRSLAGALRIDLRRSLRNFPDIDATTFRFTDVAAAAAATSDRQAFAKEIFDRLRMVTGAEAPNDALPADQMDALRWLAQLAVNIVDFIDSDDYSTPFRWHVGANAHYVYGVESPRLVINEYYAQFDNDRANLAGNPPLQANQYRLNVWVELFNPLSHNPAQPANVTENGNARLHNGTWSVYRLRVTQKRNQNLFARANTAGWPDNGMKSQVVQDWGPDDTTRIVLPSNGAYSTPATNASEKQTGFYVIGPDPDYGNAAPDLSAADTGLKPLLTFASPQLSLPISVESDVDNYSDPTDPVNKPDQAAALLLERLVNPYLKPNPPEGDPAYDPTSPVNPYITVDAVEQLRVNDGRIATEKVGNRVPPVVTTRKAVGKYHPFAALTALWKDQDPANAALTQPLHTFFRHNAKESPAAGLVLTGTNTAANTNTVQVPFDPLMHADRVPVSLAELLHVSACRPHELTQQFMTATAETQRFQHRARWTDERNRIVRLLDHLTLSPYTSGLAANGRLPGKVNLNTIRDINVFRALCDAVAAGTPGPNRFTEADVDAVFSSLIASRDNGGDGNPIRSLSVAYANEAAGSLMPGTRGVNNTLLRTGAALPAPAVTTWDGDGRQLLIEPPSATFAADQAMRRFELLTKLMNHVTTRSNVFGVWVTIGFFQVVDESTSPMKLGAEIVWPNTGVIRHKGFALLDRSQLQIFPTRDPINSLPLCRLAAPVTLTSPDELYQGKRTLVNLIDTNGLAINATNPLYNPNTNRPWIPRPGAIITIQPGTEDEETVELVANGANLEATFRKPHPNPARPTDPLIVISRGNPGPWVRYNPALDIGGTDATTGGPDDPRVGKVVLYHEIE